MRDEQRWNRGLITERVMLARLGIARFGFFPALTARSERTPIRLKLQQAKQRTKAESKGGK